MGSQMNIQGRLPTDSALSVMAAIVCKCPFCGSGENDRRDTFLLGDGIVVFKCWACDEFGVTTPYIYYTGRHKWGRGCELYAHRMHLDDVRALPGVPSGFGFPF